MAIPDCINRKFMDNYDDDDDEPITFKRNNTTSKQNEFKAAPKNTPGSIAKVTREGSTARKASDLTPATGTLKVVPDGRCDFVANTDDSDDDKPLTLRHRLASTTVQINNPTKSSNLNNKSSDSDDDKPLSLRIPIKLNDNSSDSDDEKPLSLRVSRNAMGMQKHCSLQANKLLSSQSNNSTISQKPSSSKMFPKSIPTTSIKKSSDSDDEKPLAAKFQQNGFSKSYSGNAGMSGKNPNKRPLGSIDNSQSSNKKVKISGPPGPTKVKHEPIVKEVLRTHVDDEDDDDDHVPIGQRIKKSSSAINQSATKKIVKKVVSTSFKKENKKTIKAVKNSKFSKSSKMQPGSGEGQKWTTLEHSGVIFPPPYKPHGTKMFYNGQPVDLTPEQEEVATMFAVMKDTEYATKKIFIDNFMNDWRMVLGKNHVIKKFELCDFTPIYEWHMKEKEKKKQMSAEEKKALKEEKMKQEQKYMWAIVDGVKEKVGNFRVEPPGLFRGRGEHPKMGKLKKRIQPRDITINIGKNAPIPECPIPGQRWKETRHDNTVTWLAYWNDPINSKEFKYVFLAASSSLKGQSDKEKYEKARKLKDYIHNIRATYTRDFTSKDEAKRQIAVATYLIDKLALRAGNEKDDDEADTVGCCTLKVENVTLVPPNKLQFDFLGKDSIRYFNTVEVELPVYKAIGGFRTSDRKKGGDDLFDKLDTSKLNTHLKELMPGLTAKVFRTYNASITLDQMLNKETKDGSVPEKIAVYQSANKEVAIICNHQRSVSKSHDAQMTRLDQKIADLRAEQEELKVDLSRARKGKPPLKDAYGKTKRNLSPEALEKKLVQIDAKIEKMELDRKIKDDLKTVALGTSKINYLDPRISVAWCKRHEVPIEKIFNKSLLAKFAWAMDVDPAFRF